MNNNKNIVIKSTSQALDNNPDWLKEKRNSFQDDFNRMPLPQRGLHLWRYTNPEKFVSVDDNGNKISIRENFESTKNVEIENLKNDHLETLITDLAGEKIEILNNENANDKLIICSLTDAIEKHENLASKHLYSLVNSETGKFEALNGALWKNGIFIYLPKNTKIEKPIHLLRESSLEQSSQFFRLLVVVEENSELTIVDEYGGGSNTHGENCSNSNSVVEIIAGQTSRVSYIPLQQLGSNAKYYMTYRCNLDNDAQVMTIPLVLGAPISKNNFGVILNGQGADSKILGLSFGSHHQHSDSHTLHHHTVGKTTSDINFKVMLKDKALSAYTGLIRIDRNAKTCEAYQENRNLLLNKGCKAEAIPELEILNEDVMCSHGATLGPIDPEMIFYLGCRGIEKDMAIQMLVEGFVESTISLMPEDLKDRIRIIVSKRLEQL